MHLNSGKMMKGKFIQLHITASQTVDKIKKKTAVPTISQSVAKAAN